LEDREEGVFLFSRPFFGDEFVCAICEDVLFSPGNEFFILRGVFFLEEFCHIGGKVSVFGDTTPGVYAKTNTRQRGIGIKNTRHALRGET